MLAEGGSNQGGTSGKGRERPWAHDSCSWGPLLYTLCLEHPRKAQEYIAFLNLHSVQKREVAIGLFVQPKLASWPSPMGSADTLGRGLLSRIDTSVVPSFDDDYLEASPLRAFPNGLEIPSVRLSTSPIQDEPSSTHHPQPIPTNLRARNESRKLLSHVLRQLAHRKKPPPIKDTVWNRNNDRNIRGFGMVALKDFVKLVPDKRLGIQSDSDDEENRDFSTDGTFDLMVQLKDVLTMSIAQGWKIFDDGCAASFHHTPPLNAFQHSIPSKHGRCKSEILLFSVSSIAK